MIGKFRGWWVDGLMGGLSDWLVDWPVALGVWTLGWLIDWLVGLLGAWAEHAAVKRAWLKWAIQMWLVCCLAFIAVGAFHGPCFECFVD